MSATSHTPFSSTALINIPPLISDPQFTSRTQSKVVNDKYNRIIRTARLDSKTFPSPRYIVLKCALTMYSSSKNCFLFLIYAKTPKLCIFFIAVYKHFNFVRFRLVHVRTCTTCIYALNDVHALCFPHKATVHVRT